MRPGPRVEYRLACRRVHFGRTSLGPDTGWSRGPLAWPRFTGCFFRRKVLKLIRAQTARIMSSKFSEPCKCILGSYAYLTSRSN